uniref:hypothetical protein n=1 Tax=Granulosicoccus sp. 3-233 TaxID=3417969 RepID=UPI003D3508A3
PKNETTFQSANLNENTVYADTFSNLSLKMTHTNPRRPTHVFLHVCHEALLVVLHEGASTHKQIGSHVSVIHTVENLEGMTVGKVDGVAERMEKAIKDTDARLAKRFDEEKAKGELPADFPSMARARLLHDMRQGCVHRSRAGWSAKDLSQDLEDRTRMILLH